MNAIVVFVETWIEAMSLSNSDDSSCMLTKSGAPNSGQRADERSGTNLRWVERALDNMLVRRRQNASRWMTLAQRLLSFDELDDVLSKIEIGARADWATTLAAALDIRYSFNGLENLQMIGDRPVILFGNHPIGSGNVVGMCVLLANHFSDHRIIGHRYMRFTPSLSEKMIPVDPFRSMSPINLEALVKLRREFGTRYQALGLFPAGNSSQLKMSGAISDRRWSDAFVRIARHHDALLVPVWFSGRNRLRYYIASRIRAELGFLALPAEFLRLRGKSITVSIGKPISPDLLRVIPNRHAQMSFLRASVYEIERERATPPAAANASRRSGATCVRIAQPRALDPVPVGKHLELRFFDSDATRQIEELARPVARDELDDATTHVILTPRDRLVPCAHWQVLDWRQFTPSELYRISRVRRTFQLPGDVVRAARNWLEIMNFGIGEQCAGLATLKQIRMALCRSVAVSKQATELIGVVTPQETSFVLAGLQFAMLQKARGDAALLRSGAALDLIGATQHHDWRPARDTIGGGRIGPIDPLLRIFARLGVRFGAAGLSA
jgi:Acyltransferase